MSSSVEDEQLVDGLEGEGVLLAGAFDLLGAAVVESAALRDDGRRCDADVDQAAVVVLLWWVRSADPEGFASPDEATAVAWRERGTRLAGRLASAPPLRTKVHTAPRERMFDVRVQPLPSFTLRCVEQIWSRRWG